MDPATLVVLAGLGLLAAKAATRRQDRTSGPLAMRAPLPSPRGGTAFPESIPARDAFILDAVKNGQADVRWAFVRTSYQGHEGEFRVFADALKVQGVRVTLTAPGKQRVADAMGCLLLTLKLADLIWAQRQVTISPFPMSSTEHDLLVMSTVARMIEHSQKIDAAIAALPSPPEGIVSTVGKHWVIDDALDLPSHKGRAENYGWHNLKTGPSCATPAGGPGCHVIQDPGWRHDLGHTDYSQTCTLVSRECRVDGQARDLVDVLRDPVLAFLASHKGAMRVLRQPGT
jgi:hypothetical protein